MPEDPLKAIAEGCARDVALLTGTTEDETRFWIKYEPLAALHPGLDHSVIYTGH